MNKERASQGPSVFADWQMVPQLLGRLGSIVPLQASKEERVENEERESETRTSGLRLRLSLTTSPPACLPACTLVLVPR